MPKSSVRKPFTSAFLSRSFLILNLVLGTSILPALAQTTHWQMTSTGDDWILEHNNGTGAAALFGIKQASNTRLNFYGDGRIGAKEYCKLDGSLCFDGDQIDTMEGDIAALSSGTFTGDLVGQALTDSDDDVLELGDGVNDTVRISASTPIQIGSTYTLPIIDGGIGHVLTTNGSGVAGWQVLPAEVDGSVSNELQTIAAGGTTSPTITLSDSGGTVTFASSGLASLSQAGGTITISATGDGVDDADNNASNELQDLALNTGTNILTLTNDPTPVNIDLTSYLDNTDDQTISFNSGDNLLTISGSGDTADLSSLAGGATVLDELGDATKTSDTLFVATNPALSTGIRNTGVGVDVLLNNTTGERNTAIGHWAMLDNTSGRRSVAVGASALQKNDSGIDNVAVGHGAATWNISGDGNVSVGYAALSTNEAGDGNTAVGYSAGAGVPADANFTQNTLLGYQAGFTLRTAGSNNVLLGYQAGDTLEGGADNIIIGHGADAPTSATSNYLNIGDVIVGDMDNAGEVNLGIGGVEDATKALKVYGDIQVADVGDDICLSDGTTCLSTAGGVDTDDQDLSFNTSTKFLSISDGTGADLSSLAVEVDGSVSNELQTIAAGGTTSPTITLSDSGGTVTFASSGLASLSQTGGTITISATGDGVDDADNNASNELQDLALNTGTNILTLTNDPTPVNIDLSPYLDNTDTDNQTLSFNTGTNILSISGLANSTADLSSLAGGGGATSLAGLSDGLTNASSVYLGASAGTGATGDSNTVVGISAFADDNSGGGYNVAVGHEALNANDGGFYNVGLGSGALRLNTSGGGNVATGYEALGSNTIGGNNVAVGMAALDANISGDVNVAVGHESLTSNTSGGYNVASGGSSLRSNLDGEYNVAIGYESSYGNETGSGNTVVGAQAGRGAIGNSDFNNNTILGHKAGYLLQTGGSNNVLLGYQAGDTLTTGDSNIVLGYDADLPSSDASSYLNIGDVIVGDMDNAGEVNLGIGGVEDATKALKVYGDIQVADVGDDICLSDGTTCLSTAGGVDTDDQDLSFNTSTKFLSISDGTGADLSSLAVEVDGSVSNELQTIAAGGTTSPTITLSDSGGTVTFASSGLASLSQTGGTITISATGDGVDDADNNASNELQDLALNTGTNILTLTNDPTPVNIDLSPYLDNTDTDNQTLSFNTGTNILSISGLANSTADLSSLAGSSVFKAGSTGTGSITSVQNDTNGGDATGDNSFAVGDIASASAFNAISMGTSTTASGQYSLALGGFTTASGETSIAIGSTSVASGYGSIALGGNLVAPSGFEIAIGRYNTTYTPSTTDSTWTTSDRLFVIGNGATAGAKNDALLMTKDGNTVVDGDWAFSEHNVENVGELQFADLASDASHWVATEDTTTANALILDYNGGADEMILETTGKVTFLGDVNANSDVSLKKNIQTLNGALDKVSSLRGVSYEWKDDAREAGTRIGLIAQEVEAVYPEFVSVGGDGIKSLNYAGLVAPLIESVKTLKAENDDLKAQLVDFETRLQALEN